MPLPNEYLQYPLRKIGMDQARYDNTPSRQRKVSWPRNARVALWVVPALEWYTLNSKDQAWRPSGDQYVSERPYPDYRWYTYRDYGTRVGIFRIMKVLDDFGIIASVPMNSAIAQRHPFLLNEVLRRKWEIIGHGIHMDYIHSEELSPNAEVGYIREALGSLRKLSGQQVKGWLSPAKSESLRTLDLLSAEKIQYVCDWVNDDLPYPLVAAQGVIYAMPHSSTISDRSIILDLGHTEEEFVQQVRDQFDTLYKEAAEFGGRIMALTLHPWIIGYPHRIKFLREALGYILKHDGVWCATGTEILTAYLAQV